jgi:hypothetical protein
MTQPDQMLVFDCINCGNARFSIAFDSLTSTRSPVTTFLCPSCKSYNAVSKRDAGGGYLISKDVTYETVDKTGPSST